MKFLLDFLLSIVLFLVQMLLETIGIIDDFLMAVMTGFGLPAGFQVGVLIAVALLLVIAAFRAIGGIFAVVIFVLLGLILVHWMMPGSQVPHSVLPLDWRAPGTIQL